MYKILEKEILNDVVQKMVIEAPFVARKCEPGQFIILRVAENGERIPLTITDFDREKNSVSIVYQVLGYTTQLLAQKQVGDELIDFVGPLGKAAPMKKHKRVLGIGGGVGSAPLYPQLKKMASMGTKVDVILGGRDENLVILKDEFNKICDNVYYATNDGSLGHQGFVTDVLKQLIDKGEQYDEVIAIGPLIMMKAVVDITKPLNIPTGVSLNPVMIDGTGMCGGCRVTVGNETKFACVDGPDFDGLLVDFDEAMQRQAHFVAEEKHACRLDGVKNG
ncbi:sulfide/dihydroorotate dehydrogenase-like FAD/NAD-binding protein [Vallitaleaceae bacterium 9-2]